MKLFLVGGFLGSGKTTAIHQAAISFFKHIKKVAVITNDQGSDLVDTHFIKMAGIRTEEITNGCFCCNYPQFVEAIDSLRKDEAPEVIFAESVGSCTDLVATIAKPLAKFKPEISVVISVFADAQLLDTLMSGKASFIDENVRYIYKKQLVEADILIVNKIDLLSDDELKNIKSQIEQEYPEKIILYQNSLDENSIRTWLLTLSRFELRKERISLELNYDLYAKGEEILAWVDQRIKIETTDFSAHAVALQIIHEIYSSIKKTKSPVAHLKFLLDDGIEQRKISFTTLDDQFLEFTPVDNSVNKISMVLNARIQTGSSKLERLVVDIVDRIREQTGSEIVIEKKAAFQPGYPKPTYRMA